VLSQPVVDKETKMRETLRILSMKTSAYGLSFFFTQAIFAFFTSIFISLTFLLIGFFQGKGFFAFIAFWMAVLVYGFSTIFMSMGLSTLFSDSKIASQIGSLVLIVPLAVY
jgi:ABC-type multidrug transport system permease subunit